MATTRRPTVATAALIKMAESIERQATESQKAWIICGQFDKYGECMATAGVLRRAAAEKSIWARREMLRNKGIAA